MDSLIFEFIIPLISFALIIFVLLKKIKFSENDRINLGIALTLSLIGTYSLYQLKLSSLLVSLSGIFVAAIFILVLLIAIFKKSLENIKEQKK